MTSVKADCWFWTFLPRTIMLQGVRQESSCWTRSASTSAVPYLQGVQWWLTKYLGTYASK